MRLRAVLEGRRVERARRHFPEIERRHLAPRRVPHERKAAPTDAARSRLHDAKRERDADRSVDSIAARSQRLDADPRRHPAFRGHRELVAVRSCAGVVRWSLDDEAASRTSESDAESERQQM